jgi:HlyD family secretion protein
LQAALDSNTDDLEKTTVVAPMDGVVTSLQKEEGEVVIGAQSFQPTVIMVIADLSVMETEILVDETDIQHVTLGQTAEVRVDALQDVKVKGEVTEIGSSAIARGTTGVPSSAATSTANQAKDFEVKVTLRDPPAALRPGLNATADITTGVKKGVVAVPIQAVVVREVDKEGKVVDPTATPTPGSGPGPGTSGTPARSKNEEKDGVFVVENGLARFRPIKTGLIGETEVEILEGLKEGEELVTGSYRTLRTLKDEAKVRVETPRKDTP